MFSKLFFLNLHFKTYSKLWEKKYPKEKVSQIYLEDIFLNQGYSINFTSTIPQMLSTLCITAAVMMGWLVAGGTGMGLPGGPAQGGVWTRADAA